MTPADKLILAVKHALRIETAHLMYLQDAGEQDDGIAMSAARHNIGIYREALDYHKKHNKSLANNKAMGQDNRHENT